MCGIAKVADKKSEILAWLSPLKPQIRCQDFRTRRVDEVGDWLLQTQEYRNWFGGISGGSPDGSALFCHGGPGVGKTILGKKEDVRGKKIIANEL